MSRPATNACLNLQARDVVTDQSHSFLGDIAGRFDARRSQKQAPKKATFRRRWLAFFIKLGVFCLFKSQVKAQSTQFVNQHIE